MVKLSISRQRSQCFKLADNVAHMRVRTEVSDERRARGALHLFKLFGPQ